MAAGPGSAQARQDILKSQGERQPVVRKKPGRAKYGDITLKRGHASSADIAEWRKSLRPLNTRPGIRGRRIHGRPDRLSRETQQLDLLLQRLQRSMQRYERLKKARGSARARGADTSSIDGRLKAQVKDIEKQAEEIRNQAKRLSTQFRGSDRKSNQTTALISRIMRAMKEMRSVGAASRSGL
ncbi:MAG: hypothetical protein ACLFWF_11065 [Alphaproteobacteria bacterium]